MSLACTEICVGDRVIRARQDQTLLSDGRVLKNLLKLEDNYLVPTTYFECVQDDVKPYMRKIVATWMMQVCEEQRCEEDVFPLSMNYLDRFLSVQAIRRTELQSLGSACMLVASKVKETLPLTTEKLVIYTDNSVRQEELLDFELLLLMKLKWDLLAVTPVDFVDQILHQLGVAHPDVLAQARKHANTFIHLCCTDHKFSVYTPSMIAAGSVAAAISGLHVTTGLPLSRPRLLARLQDIINVDSDILRQCLEQVESALTSSLLQVPPHPNSKRAEQAGGVQDCGVGGGAGVDMAADSPLLSAAGTDCREVDSTPTDVDMVY